MAELAAMGMKKVKAMNDDLIEMPTIKTLFTDEDRAQFSDVTRETVIDLMLTTQEILDRDREPFEDLTRILVDHGVKISSEKSVHVVRLAIRLIGELSPLAKSDEMRAFYQRGGRGAEDASDS